MVYTSIQQSFEAKLALYFDRGDEAVWLKEYIKKPQFLQQLQFVWGCSDFAADQAICIPVVSPVGGKRRSS